MQDTVINYGFRKMDLTPRGEGFKSKGIENKAEKIVDNFSKSIVIISPKKYLSTQLFKYFHTLIIYLTFNIKYTFTPSLRDRRQILLLKSGEFEPINQLLLPLKS